jgi:hypothetical protein
MKKINILLFILFIGINIAQVTAQSFVENTACSAICLDTSQNALVGKLAPQNGISLNQFLPCGGGTTEDNPSWWMLRPSSNLLTFSIVATNCIAGNGAIGVQMTLWKGESCGDLAVAQCFEGMAGAITANVVPCKTYFLQIDGLSESVCDVTINYDNKQILKQVDKPTITGPNQICKGANGVYCASISSMAGCRPDSWKWTVEPASAGTISGAVGSDCATLKLIGTIPANGKIKVCVEPVFKGKCPPQVQKECKEIEVLDLKPATCDLTLCPESRPVVYELIKCIRTVNPTMNVPFMPETFIVGNSFLPGTTTTKKIDYTVTGSGCKGEVNVRVKVLENLDIILPAIILCEGDKVAVKGEEFTCALASNSLKTIKRETSEIDKELGACDTTFKFLVQCVKVKLANFPKGVLDCNTKSITLNAEAAGTTTFPLNITNTTFTGVGKRAYTWSKNGVTLVGETNPTLVVTSAGKYEVTLSYTYEVMQTINSIPVVTKKTCSKATSVEITEDNSPTVAETPIVVTTPCLSGINDTASYYISPTANATYVWSVTGNATILNGNTNPNVLVKSGNAPYQVCVEKTVCAKKDTKCIDVKPIAVPNAKASVNSPICATTSALFNASGGDFYQWSGPNNFSATIHNPILTNVETKQSGNYSVTVSNSTNCKNILTVNLEVKNCVATKDILTEANIEIFPNPIQNNLTVSANAVIQKIEISNTLGQILLSQNVDNQKISINTSLMPNGVYMAKVYLGQNIFKEFKIIKE